MPHKTIATILVTVIVAAAITVAVATGLAGAVNLSNTGWATIGILVLIMTVVIRYLIWRLK